MTHKTTDLTTIRNRPALFTWGRVEKVHDVGRYTIVEFMTEPAMNARRSFHVYVDGEDKNTDAETLERALLIAIAAGCMMRGMVDSAGYFAAKMLGLP